MKYRIYICNEFKPKKMKENFNFKLVNGVFDPSEAKKILMDLINTKINYHSLEAFRNHIRFNTEISSSEKRIEELKKTRESIQEIIELAEKNNMKLEVKSEIFIEFKL